MHFKGTEVVFFTNSTTALASGTKNEGSMSAAALLPTINVDTLERPFSDDEMMCVCSTMMILNQLHARSNPGSESSNVAQCWGLSPRDGIYPGSIAAFAENLRAFSIQARQLASLAVQGVALAESQSL